MKIKTLVAMAALALLVGVPARAQQVVSSNVVGYSKLTMNAGGYTMIANPFTEVGTGLDIAINDMFAEDTTDANAGTSAANADTIEVWAGDRYTTYFLRSAATPYWMKSGDRKATTDALPPGEGAFYRNSSPDTPVVLTISGEVKADSETLHIIPGYNLVKNPFPTALSFDNFVVEGATAGTSAANADTIEVWAGDRYTTYFLRSAATPYWMKSGDRKPTTDTIDPYTGFFYRALGSTQFDVTIQSPLTESSNNGD